MAEEDREQIIDIFNYYIANSFAAYPESEVPYEAFDIFLQMTKGYPTGKVEDEDGKIIGFGLALSGSRITVPMKCVEYGMPDA